MRRPDPVLGFDEVTTMALGEEDDSPIDHDVTTMALGEEDDSPVDDTVTTMALGEEDDSPIDQPIDQPDPRVTTTVDDLSDPADDVVDPSDWATTTVEDLADMPEDWSTVEVGELGPSDPIYVPEVPGTPDDWATTTVDDLVPEVETAPEVDDWGDVAL